MELETTSSKYLSDQTTLNMDEKIGSLFQPDTLVAAHYFENLRRKSPLEPEKRLMLAVLEDGVLCFQDNAWAQTGKRKKLFEDAEDWILEAGDDWVFSFVNICETCGIHPQYLRNGLMEWKQRRLRGHSRAEAPRLQTKTQTKIQQGETMYG